MSAGQKRGCLEGGHRIRPKTEYRSLDAARRGLDWMVENLLAIRENLRAYECRYSPADDPHFHVGRKPGEVRKQYGRMPADGGNHRR